MACIDSDALSSKRSETAAWTFMGMVASRKTTGASCTGINTGRRFSGLPMGREMLELLKFDIDAIGLCCTPLSCLDTIVASLPEIRSVGSFETVLS